MLSIPTLPVITKIPVITLFLILYYFFAIHFITQYLPGTSQNEPAVVDPFGLYFHDDSHHTEPRWVSFADYAAIPFFYINKGIVETQRLITVTSICDVEQFYQAQNVASTFQTGPLSFTIYIHQNYKKINTTKLHSVLHSYFGNSSSLYDINIGIVAINTSSQVYINASKERGFDETTPLEFTTPTNVLRNLAEHQAQTDWIFNIDIDLWYLSETMHNNQYIKSLVDDMNSMISDTQYGLKTVFVVSVFEIIDEFDDTSDFDKLSKRTLLDLVYLDEVVPFHEGKHAHKCSDYDTWYTAGKPYRLDFNEVYCHWAYEPLFIVHKNVSRSIPYQWDNEYLGKGLSRVERVYKLRHLCFNFVIMHNLFMIHVPDPIVVHHDRISIEQRHKWRKYNLDLFRSTMRMYKDDPYTCVGVTTD